MGEWHRRVAHAGPEIQCMPEATFARCFGLIYLRPWIDNGISGKYRDVIHANSHFLLTCKLREIQNPGIFDNP